jgi:restriction endonuclease S subunit
MDYDGNGVKFSKGDILFGKLRPYLAKVMRAQSEGEALGDILVYRPTKIINSQFGFYSFISHRFINIVNSYTYGVKMPRANPMIIGDLLFIYPNDLKIQKQIVDFLDKKTEKIDQAVQKIQEQIKKLKEYRASLIYNAVTGKITI